MVRVRIAPSPTGAIHVGLARSALYNYLFARKHKGRFILRIEDTDPSRSTKESTETILAGLSWLGLDWDEGPYFQSQRFPIYQKYAQRLVAEGKAYYCYCPKERLEEERKKAQEKKIPYRYDRRCLYLSEKEKETLKRENQPKVIRFLAPIQEVSFTDLIHGEIKKGPGEIEDFILLRADGSPTYNFACVIDDAEMGINYVIRAVEHIANTPKQILLYSALNLPIPYFAHLPLILGPDRKKLSKRHGALSLMEYKEMGFLPSALLNYLALLGWSPGGDKEIMTKEEMIELFSLERVNKANAIFDSKKLEWMNSVYIRNSKPEELLPHLKGFLDTEGEVAEGKLLSAINLSKERARRLDDLAEAVSIFFKEKIIYKEEEIKRFLIPENKERLGKLAERLFSLPEWGKEITETTLRQLAEEMKIKAADLIHPTRVALTGKTVGPPLFDVIAVLGRDLTIKRLKEFTSLIP
jgi:glutamyl-tRNA synthetase